MLVDTTFWIDLFEEQRDGKVGRAKIFLASHRGVALKVSLITWGELAPGFRTPEQVDNLLRRVRVLNLHKQVAWEAGRIERELSERGSRLGENDNWIAATARAWGLRLVTRDKAFSRVPGLNVVKY